MKFIGRAYLNRRYTRLVPSLVIAGVVAVVFVMALPSVHGQQTSPLGIAIDLILVALQTALFPFARETYYRLTGPLRGAMPVLIMPLPHPGRGVPVQVVGVRDPGVRDNPAGPDRFRLSQCYRVHGNQ